MISTNTGELLCLSEDYLCQTANFCKNVQISQLNKIEKLKNHFKTVK